MCPQPAPTGGARRRGPETPRSARGCARRALLRQRLQRLQNAVRAGVHPDRRQIAPVDQSVLVDHEQRPLRGALARAVRTVGSGHLTLRFEVGQTAGSAASGERRRRCGTTRRPPRSRSAPPGADGTRGESRCRAHLITAHRAPVRGVERQNDGLAAEVRQRHLLVRRRVQREGTAIAL